MASERIKYIDFIKGICIFLVVWGHCIQNMGTKNDAFFDNPVHIFIVSFHMPIFMILSGFFFSTSIKNKNFSHITLKKARQILLPCFSWALVGIILSYRESYSNLSFIELTKQLLYNTCNSFWFLRSVFVCYMITLISLHILKKDYIACLFSILIMLLLPDNFRLALDKFMFPFFWLGYFLHKNIDYLTVNRNKIIIYSCVIFLLMLCFWKKDYYIYITGMSFYNLQGKHIQFFDFWPRFNIVIFRYAIGIAGSIFFFFLLQVCYRPKIFKWIENIGTITLGIYIIHLFLMKYLIAKYNLSHLGAIYNFIITPITAIGLIILCKIIINILQKYNVTHTLFLGAQLKH